MALGERQETSEINVTEFSVFSSFLRPNKYSSNEYGTQSAIRSTEDVQVERLDDCWAELIGSHKPNTYLKMDTQGWDLEVLRGAEGCLPDIVAFQSEVSVQQFYDGMPTMTESLNTIERIGYSMSGLFPVNLDKAMRVIDFDCVAIRVGQQQTAE